MAAGADPLRAKGIAAGVKSAPVIKVRPAPMAPAPEAVKAQLEAKWAPREARRAARAAGAAPMTRPGPMVVPPPGEVAPVTPPPDVKRRAGAGKPKKPDAPGGGGGTAATMGASMLMGGGGGPEQQTTGITAGVEMKELIEKIAVEMKDATPEERLEAVAAISMESGFNTALLAEARKCGFSDGSEKTASEKKPEEKKAGEPKVLHSRFTVQDIIGHLAAQFGRVEGVEKDASQETPRIKLAKLVEAELARPT